MKTPIPVRWLLVVLHCMVRLPWKMMRSHAFFCRESRSYSGRSFLTSPLRVSRAWLWFMWYEVSYEFRNIRMELNV